MMGTPETAIPQAARMADAPLRYSPAQKWLHWLMAAIILLIMIPAGLTMTRLGEGETTNRLYELHKSFGLIVFGLAVIRDRKSTRLNSSHANISYAVFCLKKKRPQS